MRLRIGQLAKKLNKTKQTIWNYMKSNKLRFHQDVQGGNRYFIWSEVVEDLNLDKEIIEHNKINIAYARVSSKSQQKDLEYQIQMLEQFCSSKGYCFITISDIASGLNYNRKGLNQIIEKIYNNEVDKIIVNHKDRFCRFGFEFIQYICSKHNVKIEIINNNDIIKTYEQEMVEDILSVLTCYSAKLYGLRSHKNKKIVEENKKLWK